MASELKILWTENALQDLLSIKEYISLDSSERANQWIQELFSIGETLSRFPQRGRIVPEFNRENIRELLIENYRLVYRVKPTSVEVLAVFEGHRQLKKKSLKSKT